MTDAERDLAAARVAIAKDLQAHLDGRSPALDRSTVVALLVAMQQVIAKEEAPLFTPARRTRGEKRDRAALAACVQAAGTYIRFCQQHVGVEGIDRAPVPVVSAAFGISPRQAMEWKHLGVDLETPEDMTIEEHFRYVKAFMAGSAVQYPRFGGSSFGAVRKRMRGEA